MSANQYNVLLKNHFYHDGCGLFLDDSAPSTECKGSLNCLMMKKWCKSYNVVFTLLTAPENCHHEYSIWGNIFWQNGVHHSSTFPEAYTSKGALKLFQLVAAQAGIRFMYIFPLICHLCKLNNYLKCLLNMLSFFIHWHVSQWNQSP